MRLHGLPGAAAATHMPTSDASPPSSRGDDQQGDTADHAGGSRARGRASVAAIATVSGLLTLLAAGNVQVSVQFGDTTRPSPAAAPPSRSLELIPIPTTPQSPCTDHAVLFVKFHKVGGTTFMRLINRAFNTTTELCANSCGAECPRGETTSLCTGHASLKATSRVLRNAWSLQHAASLPAEERRARQHAALLKSGAKWLRPCRGGAAPHVGLRTATLLRDPAERLRSKYYFQRNTSRCSRNLGDLCAATRMTFLEWMTAREKHGADDKVGTDLQACCEYVTRLGGGSVDLAVRTLQSQFDVVGVTERYEEAVLMLGDALELPPERLRYGASSTVEVARNNTAAKLPWTEAERRAADKLTAKDRKVYEVAKDLARRRAEALYGGPRALRAAVHEYRGTTRREGGATGDRRVRKHND